MPRHRGQAGHGVAVWVRAGVGARHGGDHGGLNHPLQLLACGYGIDGGNKGTAGSRHVRSKLLQEGAGNGVAAAGVGLGVPGGAAAAAGGAVQVPGVVLVHGPLGWKPSPPGSARSHHPVKSSSPTPTSQSTGVGVKESAGPGAHGEAEPALPVRGAPVSQCAPVPAPRSLPPSAARSAPAPMSQ